MKIKFENSQTISEGRVSAKNKTFVEIHSVIFIIFLNVKLNGFFHVNNFRRENLGLE